jgi:hypothetical protein
MSLTDGVEQIKHLTEACNLNILVWGPGAGALEHYEKRQKMQQEICKCFRNADVRFSESINLNEVLPGAEQLSVPQQELWHLAACDVCIVLDTSKGAGEEIAHFVGSYLAHKLLILTHEKYQTLTSFPSALREHQNQLFYTNFQYDSCSLVEYVLTRLRTVALGKLFGMRV